MAVWNPFSAIGRLFERPNAPPPDILEAYAHEVIPVLDRAEWLYQYWLEQASLFSDGEQLGNVAAIQRWEMASMERSLERVVPPSALADAHQRVLDALEMASRAAQLLSSGSRFHNANALCEGWSLLDGSRERRLAALRVMHRHLEPRTMTPVGLGTDSPTPSPAPTPPPSAPAPPPSAATAVDAPAEGPAGDAPDRPPPGGA